MKLIIIQGAPATGKTTLAKKLAADLNCPLFSKDGYKEMKFDEINRVPTMKEWVAFEVEARKKLYEKIESHEYNDFFIIESNLNVKDKAVIKKSLTKDDTVREVYFYARGLTSLKRYYRRNKEGGWHKGHRASTVGYPIVLWLNFLSLIHMPLHKPLELSEHTLKVNTTDFSKVDYGQILKFVKG